MDQLVIDSITLKQLQDAIPARLFERSLLKSCLYLIYNLLLVFITFLAFYYLLNYVVPQAFFWPVVLIYWLVQSTVAVGLWIIAHECGHKAFSAYQSINDVIGLILHSALFIPYHAWKISHSMHHRYTAHMDKDMAFVPLTRHEYVTERYRLLALADGKARERFVKRQTVQADPKDRHLNDYWTDIPLLATIIYMPFLASALFFGFPLYLSTCLSGPSYCRKTRASHFTSRSPIFNGNHGTEIMLSNIGLLSMVAILSYASYLTSFKTIAIYYIGPYILVSAWLVVITYLHHTDPRLPHYRDGSWTYVKGALSTIDRNYGWLINHLHHHIGDTHVVHHLFSRIPFYNAIEATEIIKPLLGPHYNCDENFFLKSLWNNFVFCHYVNDEGEVVYYRP